jgi:NADH-quinone oxidoreductase subunit N
LLLAFDRFNFLPEISLAFAFLFLLLAPLFFNQISRFLQYIPKAFFSSSAFFRLANFSILLILSYQVFLTGHAFFISDSNLALFLVKISLLVFVLAYSLLSFPILQFEFFFLLQLSIFALVLFVQTTDFLTFYLSMELFSFASYILTALHLSSLISLEAAFKYFVLGAFASTFLLFGSSYLYGSGGTLLFSDFQLLLPLFVTFQQSLHSLFLGLSTLLLGLFFKLGLAPFHSWLPDVYLAAPRAVSAFFALIPKFFIFIVLLRILLLFHDFHAFSSLLLGASATLSLLLGAFSALLQTFLLRLLAFASIVNYGFATFVLVLDHFLAIFSSLSFLYIYTFLSFSLFSFFSTFHNKFQLNLVVLEDFSALSSFRIPVIFLVLFLFSNAGIPPFIGFFGKFFIVLSLFFEHFSVTAFFLFFFSAFTAFYYLRIIRFTLFSRVPHFHFNSSILVNDSHATSFWVFPNLFFLLFPVPFLAFTYEISRHLISSFCLLI